MAAEVSNNPLIINSPFKEPTQHYTLGADESDLKLVHSRRPASYVVLRSDSDNDQGQIIPIVLANQIREKVSAWRAADYPGTTRITKELLHYWNSSEEGAHNRLFFCQIEAAETLIYLNEAPESDRRGLDIPSSGGQFQRLCSKMATGTGKTVVMAMVIAWQVLNKASYTLRPLRFPIVKK